MSDSEPARAAAGRTRSAILAALVVVSAALVGVLGHQSLAVPSSSATSLIDGVVPDGVTVFDDEYPAVANLDPALLGALRQAATDAAGDGVGFFVDSGWRSPQYQERLLREAVSRYGSEAEAARWVATADTSAHVSGDAVDIGHSDAAAWLSEHGAGYGLCQTYRNEPWHYELRPEAIGRGCPPMYADPTHDPRMQSSSMGGRPSQVGPRRTVPEVVRAR
jgi:D-alanyl-D-alanine carboxypeptidase